MKIKVLLSVFLFVILVILLAILLNTYVVSEAQNTGSNELKQQQKISSDFDKYAEEARKSWNIPGMAVAIVKDDKIIFSKGYGVKKLGDNDPIDAHTLFQIGSTSKAFTTTLMAMLVDEKKLNWKDKVIDHYPEFRMYDPWVTREFMVEELTEQHSGLPAYSIDALAFFGFDRNYIMNVLRFVKPISSFRTEFAYVNHLFLVAAKILEIKTGKTWEENLKERIFVPLNMNESSSDMKSLLKSKNAAFGHCLQNNQIAPAPVDFNWMYIYAPTGGINSNITDMAEWLKLHINNGQVNGKKIVSSENLNFTHSPKTIIDSENKLKAYYCNGWVYVEPKPFSAVIHDGQTSGYQSFVAFWPEQKTGIVILTNSIHHNLPKALFFYLNDLFFNSGSQHDWSKEFLDAFNKKQKDDIAKRLIKPDKPVSLLPLDKYIETYCNEFYGAVKIEKVDNMLQLTIGPDKYKFSMIHWNGNIFELKDSKEIANGNSQNFARFELDENQKVVKLTLDFLNKDGCGIFVPENKDNK